MECEVARQSHGKVHRDGDDVPHTNRVDRDFNGTWPATPGTLAAEAGCQRELSRSASSDISTALAPCGRGGARAPLVQGWCRISRCAWRSHCGRRRWTQPFFSHSLMRLSLENRIERCKNLSRGHGRGISISPVGKSGFPQSLWRVRPLEKSVLLRPAMLLVARGAFDRIHLLDRKH